MKEAAQVIRDLGLENVVVNGGHLEGVADDVLFDGHGFAEFRPKPGARGSKPNATRRRTRWRKARVVRSAI
jgi:hydroxymethylpyrimidine/phosphomethylpyrimidine kinase